MMCPPNVIKFHRDSLFYEYCSRCLHNLKILCFVSARKKTAKENGAGKSNETIWKVATASLTELRICMSYAFSSDVSYCSTFRLSRYRDKHIHISMSVRPTCGRLLNTVLV